MSYKKWVYKYKYLKFEFEEAEDLQKGYTSEFNSLFKFKKPKELPEPIIPKEDIPPKKSNKKKIRI